MIDFIADTATYNKAMSISLLQVLNSAALAAEFFFYIVLTYFLHFIALGFNSCDF